MWEEWKLRVEGQLHCNWWAWQIYDPNCPWYVWNVVKMWMIHWLAPSDQQLVLRCNSFMEAMETVRRNHSPDDDNTVMEVSKKLWNAKLGEKEPPGELIKRMLDMHATLQSLGNLSMRFSWLVPLPNVCHKTPMLMQLSQPCVLLVGISHFVHYKMHSTLDLRPSLSLVLS
jgi:hypothetical protein